MAPEPSARWSGIRGQLGAGRVRAPSLGRGGDATNAQRDTVSGVRSPGHTKASCIKEEVNHTALGEYVA